MVSTKFIGLAILAATAAAVPLEAGATTSAAAPLEQRDQPCTYGKDDTAHYGDCTGQTSSQPDGSGKYLTTEDVWSYGWFKPKCWTDLFEVDGNPSVVAYIRRRCNFGKGDTTVWSHDYSDWNEINHD